MTPNQRSRCTGATTTLQPGNSYRHYADAGFQVRLKVSILIVDHVENSRVEVARCPESAEAQALTVLCLVQQNDKTGSQVLFIPCPP